MATFQVPQFIDQKPKIVGPLTLHQFFYIAVAGGLVFTSFYIFNTFLWIMVSAVLVSIAAALAFGKVNGQDLPTVILSAFKYTVQPQMYTWKREEKKVASKSDTLEKIEKIRKQINIGKRIKSIALNVATGKTSSPEKLREVKKKESYQVAVFSTGERRLVRKVDYSE